MRPTWYLSFVAIVLSHAVTAYGVAEQRIDFESQANESQANDISWKAETTQTAASPANWAVMFDSIAPSPKRVLTIRRINDSTRSIFNLYWTRDLQLENGSLEVSVRANSGKIDQGGGLVWRARDAQNYYLARFTR